MPSHHEATDVLIIGAGPVGLSLAIGLARRGVRSVILERKTELDAHSRAIALFPRTLEIFRSLGVLGDLVASGERSSHLRLRRASSRKTLIDFDFNAYDAITQCNFVLAIPQDRTERVLFDHAQRNEAAVRMGCAFIRFDEPQGDRPIRAHFRDETGAESVIEARYLIGADGAHSVVRQQLGWELQGKTYATRAVLADVEVSEEADTADGWLAEPDRPSLLMSIRYGPRTWRLIEQAIPDDLNEALLPDHARELTEVLFGRGAWRRTIWTSAYRKHERMAPRFRSGRVILVGDAAHLNSPAGGQGMNTGVRDAHNLAWKLDAILSGKGDEGRLLSSYEVEQMDAFRNEVGPLTDAAERLQTSATWVRKLVFANLWLGRSLGLMEQAAAKHSMLFTDYGASPILFDKGELVGQRMPDVVTVEGRLHDRIGRWGMLLVRAGEPAAAQARAVAQGLELSVASLPNTLDEQGFEHVGALYVRPDQIIGLQVGPGEGVTEDAVRAAIGFRGPAASHASRSAVAPAMHVA